MYVRNSAYVIFVISYGLSLQGLDVYIDTYKAIKFKLNVNEWGNLNLGKVANGIQN